MIPIILPDGTPVGEMGPSGTYRLVRDAAGVVTALMLMVNLEDLAA